MELFPDIIMLNKDGTLLRLVTERAAKFVGGIGNIPPEQIAHKKVSCDENLVLDAYMSGLRIRTQSGRSLL